MTLVVWVAFIAFILLMLALDLGVFHRKSEAISTTEALRWTGLCALLALAFNVVVYFLYEQRWAGFVPHSNLSGQEAALQFFTGWLLEQSLSLDNVFVIALIFSYFKISREYQHRVLFWGILGALIMRGAMIALGAALMESLAWIHYAFGALLIYAAIKIVSVEEESLNPEHNMLFRIARRILPVSPKLDGENFVTTHNGRWAVTPLFLVLLIVESTDVLFAIDSIPAVFAITEDPFIVFTSNIFAILNLRSLYFALAALMDKFAYLKMGLVVILVFVGVKMGLTHHIEFPTILTFIVVVGALGIAIGLSLLNTNGKRPSAD
ncbi:MAG: TerC family protein [Oligoflexia bacterium]|nr:TerC family protein [Oligoflexia bacterium]